MLVTSLRQNADSPAGNSANSAMPHVAMNGSESQCCQGNTPEPTELEFKNALKEATQEVQAAVLDINDILEEVQYLKEEIGAELSD